MNKNLVFKLLANPRVRRFAISLLKNPRVRSYLIRQVTRQMRRR